jgi:predicted HTH transcriptional regulator
MSPREIRTTRAKLVRAAAEQYLTVKEFAVMMRIHEQTIRRRIRTRKQPGAFRVAGHWRIDLVKATAPR